MIEIPDDVAAVVLDLARSMSGPTSPEQMGYDLRRAYWLAEEMTQAFESEGVDPDDIERPEMPLLVPGSKHQSQSSGS